MNSIIRVYPLYLLAIVVFYLFTIIGFLSPISSANLVSYLSFSVFLNPNWFFNFPGLGYMSVLFLCWIMLPIYLRFFDSPKKSFIGLVYVFIISFVMTVILGRFPIIDDDELWKNWLSYISRGFQSFSAGVFLYYLCTNFHAKNYFSSTIAIYFNILLILYFIILCRFNVSQNICYFCLIIPFFFSLESYGNRFIVNPIFCFLGRYIFGIYFSHILLYYPLSIFLSGVVLWFVDISGAIIVSVIICNTYEKLLVQILKGALRKYDK